MTYIKILILALLLTGCDNIPNVAETAGKSDAITVSIVDGSNNVIFEEAFPLIYVQHYRYTYTNNNTKYAVYYDIPNGWDILFESMYISFSSIENGCIDIELPQNILFEFAITTEN